MKHLLKKITAIFVAVAMMTGFVPGLNLDQTAYALAPQTLTLIQDASADSAFIAVNDSFITNFMMTSTNDEASGSTIVNYIGDVSGLGLSGMQAALKFKLPATTATLKSAALKLKVINCSNSPKATVTLTNDNNWEQTNDSMTSSFPTMSTPLLLLANQNISPGVLNTLVLDAAVIDTKIGTTANDITLVVSGSSSTNSYFNFVADDDNLGVDAAYLELTFAQPTIESATYDVATNTLSVTGTDMVAGDTIDVSKLTLTGQGGNTYTLTSANVTASATEFSVTLNDADALQVEGLLNMNGTSAVSGTTYNLFAAANWDVTQSAAADNTGNGVTVSNVTAPTITSATYDAKTGVLTVTGTNMVGQIGSNNDIQVPLLVLRGKGMTAHQLTSAKVEITSATSFTVTLNALDKAFADMIFNINGVSASDSVPYNLEAKDDWNGLITNGDISDATNAVTVTNARPTISSAAYDASTHVLSVTGIALTVGDTIDVTRLSLLGQGENEYALTSGNVTASSATGFSVTLNDVDAINVNGLLNKNGTSSAGGTIYYLFAEADWDATAGSSSDMTDGVTVSNVTAPTITSATYDAKTGTLTVTGANLVKQVGATNDIDVPKLTLKGEAGDTYQLINTGNVEISSATTFAVTLSAADKAGVNAILNKDGTSSFGGTTYNLAAADDWNGTITNGDISDTANNGVTVSNVNQAPVITSPSTVSFAENGTGTVYTASGTDADGDAVTWSISGGADAAKFSMTSGGLLTFVSVPDYEAPSDATTDNIYDLTIKATDNGVPALFDTEALSVTVTNVNDIAPIVTTTGGTTAFVESAGAYSTPVAIDSGVTVEDSDSTTLASAAVSITGNFHSGEDMLTFSNTSAALFGNISASYNGTTGVMILTSSGATATKAQWQSALRAVTYTNNSDSPNTDTRTLSLAVNDGTNNSSAATKSISVASANDLPVVTTSGGTTAFTETAGGTSTPVAVDVGLTVSDADNSMLAGATLVISSNFHSGDMLGFTSMAGITGSYNAGTGVMTLLGTATVAQWQSALRSVTYTNTSHDPDTSTRTISITVNDGTESSTATKSVSVTAANDVPVITTSGGSAAFTETAGGTSSPISIDGGITVTDVDHTTLASATVMAISNFYPEQDVLSFVNTSAASFGNIAGSYDSATGVLTLTSSGATATTAQWQAALRAVTYTNSSHNPSTLTRAISFAVNDGLANSNTASKNVTVAAVNDAPTDIALSNTSTEAADTGTNTVIGTFSSTDADTSAGFTYTLAAGAGDTENALFNILGSALRTNTTLSAGSYHVRVKTDDGAGGTYEKAFTITATKKSAKTLAADTSDASVDNNLEITFTGDSVFETAISGVSYNGSALVQNTDYDVSSGRVTLKPSGGKAVLQTASTGNVVITATGYEDSSVSQTITAGAVHHLRVTTQPIPGAQTGDAFATQPVVTLYDQYDNVCANGVSASQSLAASAAAGTGTWTLLGTVTKTAVNGVVAFDDLTCTLLTSGTGKIVFTSDGKTIQSSAFVLPERNSSITPTTASFDKSAGSAGNADIAVTVSFNGNTLDAIKNGSTTLALGTDYSVSGNTCTISKEYLAKQSSGIVQLTFDFSLGVNPMLTVALSDSTQSGGGGSTPPAQPVVEPLTVLVTTTSAGETSSSATIAATFNPATETVSAVVGAQLAQELIDKALEAKADGEKAVARVKFGTVSGATSVDVELPRAELRQMAAAKAALQLDSGIGTITLGARELNSIVSAAPTGSVSVGIEKVDKEELSAKVQAKIKNNPIYRFEITVGDTSISRIAGSAQITIPYTPPAGTRPRYVTTYYLDSNNVLRSARGKYDAKTGTVSLSISRL